MMNWWRFRDAKTHKTSDLGMNEDDELTKMMNEDDEPTKMMKKKLGGLGTKKN